MSKHIVTVLIIVISSFAFSGTNDFAIGLDDADISCKSVSDCTSLLLACTGYCKTAINKNAKEKYLQKIERICKAYEGPHKDGTCGKRETKCLDKRCMQVNPNYIAPIVPSI